MLNFQLSRLMAVIFTPDFVITDKLSLANKFNQISENRFNGEFFSLPIPKNAPLDLPRMILISHDSTWKLEISLERTNLIFNKPLGATVKIPSIVEFGNYADQFFCAYKKGDNPRIQRLALVCERFSKLENETPAHFIANKFSNNDHFLNANTFELHSHKRYNCDAFRINSWIRFKSANLADRDRTQILLIENDLNTLPEDKDINFSESDIKKFFTFTPNHIEEILKLFF